MAAVRKIAAMRTAFLDLDDAGDIAAPVVNGRVVELEPGDYEIDPNVDLRSAAEKAWDTRRAKEAAADIAQFTAEDAKPNALEQLATEVAAKMDLQPGESVEFVPAIVTPDAAA